MDLDPLQTFLNWILLKCQTNVPRLRTVVHGLDLTLWGGDVGPIQRVDDAGVISAKRQVFDHVGHVYLQNKKGRSAGGHLLIFRAFLFKHVTHVVQTEALQVMNWKGGEKRLAGDARMSSEKHL